MRPKILSTNLENWLVSSYSKMSNEQIAQQLSEKIKKENEAQIAELRSVLPLVTSGSARGCIIRRIKRLESFDRVTEDFVKKNAKRLNCPKKSKSYLSDMNRDKITKRILQEWESKAVLISQPFAWFRTLSIGGIYYGKFENIQQLTSFKSSLCNYNRGIGASKNIQLISDYYKENLIVRIEVCPLC